MMNYDFTEHLHRFATWTAARAVQRRFTNTENISFAIDQSRLKELIDHPEIATANYDDFHRETAGRIIAAFKEKDKEASYGQAAKIIAIYIKTAIVIKDKGESALARMAHPPTDGIMLDNIKKEHKSFKSKSWTKWDEAEYFKALAFIREQFQNTHMWKTEKYWQVYRSTKSN